MPPMRPEELKYRELRQKAINAWKAADDVIEAGYASGQFDHDKIHGLQDAADDLDKQARQEWKRVNSNYWGSK